jgi:hypothetical protein
VIGELRDGSDFFRSTWQRHVVQGFAGHVETIRHPDVGPIRARLVQLRPLDDHRLLVMAHMLEDDESRERMALLLSD